MVSVIYVREAISLIILIEISISLKTELEDREKIFERTFILGIYQKICKLSELKGRKC